ncbi:unnamed protein product, partial [Strongylus vulgaris]
MFDIQKYCEHNEYEFFSIKYSKHYYANRGMKYQYSFYDSPYGERHPLFAAPSQPGLAYHRHLQPPCYHSMVTTQPVPGPSIANGPVFPPGVEPHRNPFAVQRPVQPPDEDSEEDGINCSPCCDNENV